MTTHEVEIGDVLETPYGRMEIVDIEVGFTEGGWLETRLVNENGELIESTDAENES